MRVLLTVIFIFAVVGPVVSAPLSETEVARATEIWLAQGELMPRMQVTVSRIIPYHIGDNTLAYVLELAGGGFCLSGADDLQLPVYLYVPDGQYDPGNSVVADYLETVAIRLQTLRRQIAGLESGPVPDTAELAARADLWRQLAVGPLPRDKSAATILPAAMAWSVNSAWHQGDPFFNECPQLGSYGPMKVGCVAMGMSQIMHYWQWPNTGTGSYNRIWEYRQTDNWHYATLATDPGIPPYYADRLAWASLVQSPENSRIAFIPLSGKMIEEELPSRLLVSQVFIP